MKKKMNLQMVKWFEVIFKSESGEFTFEMIVADCMKNACKIADEIFGKSSWSYVVETN